jgi:hypothetical protein
VLGILFCEMEASWRIWEAVLGVLDTMQALSYNTRMDDKPYTNTRIWRRTIPKLKLIAALTGKSMVAVIEELADAKLAELQRKPKEKASK